MLRFLSRRLLCRARPRSRSILKNLRPSFPRYHSSFHPDALKHGAIRLAEFIYLLRGAAEGGRLASAETVRFGSFDLDDGRLSRLRRDCIYRGIEVSIIDVVRRGAFNEYPAVRLGPRKGFTFPL
jgi:hypothetical protein